ncbi:MAG: glycine--tRNA ligase subunit beta, partial [bacterium (Candidatus Ratteibacteria) CG_4_8_14_3_um_filter_41_36]
MIMKKDFILEIGTEELPLADLRHLSKELPSLAEKLFTEKNLSFQKILSFATSRRIVLSVKGIPGYQSNELIEVSGPPKGIAFDKEGNPTAAAKGFARAQKVKLSQLRIKHIGKKEVICAVKKKQGKPASFILKTLLPEFLRS